MINTSTAVTVALAVALTMPAIANAQATEMAMTDDRVKDQSMTLIGDKAILAFVPFEDVTMDFRGMCPGTCKYTFKIGNGFLTLTGVERRRSGGNLYVIEGNPFDAVSVTATTATEFNADLRDDLRIYPKDLVLVEPTS